MNPTAAESIEVNEKREVEIVTRGGSDLWRSTFYGFDTINAPAVVVPVKNNCTMVVDVSFEYGARFDQAGVVAWVDDGCWAKASIEYEDEETGRLGSVATSGGHSDWATSDVPGGITSWSFRISRRGPDFLIESGPVGGELKQMRILHLASLGPTEDAGADDPDCKDQVVEMGVYACSPTTGAFTARFSSWSFQPLSWPPHTP